MKPLIEVQVAVSLAFLYFPLPPTILALIFVTPSTVEDIPSYTIRRLFDSDSELSISHKLNIFAQLKFAIAKSASSAENRTETITLKISSDL